MKSTIQSFEKTTGSSTNGLEKDYLYYWQIWHHNWDDSDVSLIRNLCTLKDKRVLEVGCGDGRITFSLAPHCRSIVGVDLDPIFIEAANQRLHAGEEQNIQFLEMDAGQLQLSDETFDAVLFPWVLQMVNDPGKALKEAHRVLKRGGHLLVIGLRSDADYDKIIGQFVLDSAVIDATTCYNNPIVNAFGHIENEIAADKGLGFSYFFENLELAYEAFLFAFERWYKTTLTTPQKLDLLVLLRKYLTEERVHLRFPATIYMTTKT